MAPVGKARRATIRCASSGARCTQQAWGAGLTEHRTAGADCSHPACCTGRGNDPGRQAGKQSARTSLEQPPATVPRKPRAQAPPIKHTTPAASPAKPCTLQRGECNHGCAGLASATPAAGHSMGALQLGVPHWDHPGATRDEHPAQFCGCGAASARPSTCRAQPPGGGGAHNGCASHPVPTWRTPPA